MNQKVYHGLHALFAVSQHFAGWEVHHSSQHILSEVPLERLLVFDDVGQTAFCAGYVRPVDVDIGESLGNGSLNAFL